MSELTEPRNTKEYVDGTFLTVVAGGTVYAGAMVALNGSGQAFAAADSSGYTVVGRAENTVTSGGTLTVRRGLFGLDNDTTSAVTTAYINKPVYVVDDHTVSIAGGTNSVVAGVCRGIDASGDVVVEVAPALAMSAPTISVSGQSAAIADLTGAPSSANINTILAALRKAGIIAAS